MDTKEKVRVQKTLPQHGMDVVKLFGTLMLSFFTISGQLRSMIKEEMEPIKQEFTQQITATFNEFTLRLDSIAADQDTVKAGIDDLEPQPPPRDRKRRRK